MDFRQEFIEFAVGQNVLRFGEFKTKAGRLSPYFFNAGLFNDGDLAEPSGEFYAKAIRASDLPSTYLFGPAYKGIPLVAATAMALAQQGTNLPMPTNRKSQRITARAACWSGHRYRPGPDRRRCHFRRHVGA